LDAIVRFSWMLNVCSIESRLVLRENRAVFPFGKQ